MVTTPRDTSMNPRLAASSITARMSCFSCTPNVTPRPPLRPWSRWSNSTTSCPIALSFHARLKCRSLVSINPWASTTGNPPPSPHSLHSLPPVAPRPLLAERGCPRLFRVLGVICFFAHRRRVPPVQHHVAVALHLKPPAPAFPRHPPGQETHLPTKRVTPRTQRQPPDRHRHPGMRYVGLGRRIFHRPSIGNCRPRSRHQRTSSLVKPLRQRCV